MEFGQLRDGLLLFHRTLLEKAQKTDNPELKELYAEAAKYLREVIKNLAEFDKRMKKIKEIEAQTSRPN